MIALVLAFACAPTTVVLSTAVASSTTVASFAHAQQASERPAVETSLATLLDRLASTDEEQAQAASAALVARGDDAALAALGGFESVAPLARRRRARLVFEAGGAACIAPAIARLDDPDAATRAQLLAFLARADLGQQALVERARVLAARALEDPDPTLRLRAQSGLSDLDELEALTLLDGLIDRLAGPERVEAARLCAQRPRARSLVVRRVQAAFAPLAEREHEVRDADVLGVLLPAYARILAETPEGDRSAARAPLLVAARDPDARIRGAATLAFETLMRRLVQLADADRAQRLLAGFEEQGFDVRVSAYQAACIELAQGREPARALAAAQRLERASSIGGERAVRVWRARAQQLSAIALLALGEERGALAPLAEEAQVLDGLLAERIDLQAKSSASEHVQVLHMRALCELTRAVCALAAAQPGAARAPVVEQATPTAPAEDAPPSAAVFETLRRVHVLELEAELVAMRGDTEVNYGFDALLGAEQGPLNLLLENARHEKWPSARALALRATLGRALATVAPAELLGFEPYAQAKQDPLADPERLASLQAIERARLDAAHEELNTLFERLMRAGVTDASAIEPADELRMVELRQEIESIQETLRTGATRGWGELLELRVPSTSCLWLARELRDEGHAGEARACALALRSALDASQSSAKYVWGLEIEAEIELIIGSSFSDENEPQRAEVELSKASERLEALETMMRERGVSELELARIKNQRASALVSLAVNANVKLGDRAKALAYFERAFALRQDDFMRVLLACYRARAGRTFEARALLREVTPSPATVYNMACTWALLGEKELALEFLRRELEENQPSPGQLAKQKEWARKDPDLASLRDDARFRALVGP